MFFGPFKMQIYHFDHSILRGLEGTQLGTHKYMAVNLEAAQFRHLPDSLPFDIGVNNQSSTPKPVQEEHPVRKETPPLLDNGQNA